MSGSVKKRTSKWDMKVETDVPAESRQGNTWPDKVGESIHNKKSSSSWNSPKVAGRRDPRLSNMDSNKSWEQLPQKRGADRDDSMNRDINEISPSMIGWGGDQSYSSSMSPGLEAWRQQNHSNSPKSSWKSPRSRSRSRSRSPPHSFKRGSDQWRDRNRSGSGVSAPTCNDFAAGRCRKGSQCRFRHLDNRDYEVRRHSGHDRAENFGGRHDDNRNPERGQVERWKGRHEDSGSSESGLAGNWGSRSERGSFSRHSKDEVLMDYSRDMISFGYGDREKHELPRNNRSTNHCNNFLKGKCYRGSSCKYAHHDVLGDGHGGWSAKDVTRDKVHDRREVHEYDHGREPFRNSAIPCKYFAAGNCRNGAHCRFSHDGPRGYSPEDSSQGDRLGLNLDNEEKSWGGPNWSDTAVAPDVAKDDRRGLDLDSNNNSWGGPKWNDTETGSGVAKDHKWGHNSDTEPNAWRDSKLRDAASSSDVAKDGKWVHSLGNEPNSWGGTKWRDTAGGPDVVKSPHHRTNRGDGQVDFGEPWATKRPKDDRWGQSSDNENRPLGGPTWSDRAAAQDMCKTPHQSENNVASMSIAESIGGSQPLDVDTAVAERYPFYNNQVEHRQIPQDSKSQTANGISLPTFEQNTTQKVLPQQQHPSLRGDAAIAFPCRDSNVRPMAPMPGQRFNHDSQSGGSSTFNMIGQSEQMLPPYSPIGQTLDLGGKTQMIVSESPSNLQGQTLFHRGGPITKSEIEDAKTSKATSVAPLTQNVVTSEQVAQITTLSASLAQIFGNGQQLPQLYAALNPPNSIGLVPSQLSPAAMSTTGTLPSSDPNQTTWSQSPYDPLVAGIESSRPDTSDQPLGFPSNPVEQNEAAEQMPLKSSLPSSLKDNFSEVTLQHESHESKQPEPVATCETVVKNDKTDQGKKEENGHSEDMDGDGQVDEECKKSKDAKAMRMFKFALVEFVKEILKPTWKGGQMSKEAHKTVVKKVVDKVTGTIQGAHVPHTPEKIDHYLSYSKPKLTKLVQAYVEKYLKG